MIRQWLIGFNYLLAGLILLFGLGALFLWWKRAEEIIPLSSHSKENRLPKGSFELAETAYLDISGPVFALNQLPPTLQLPDLRQQLIYYGKNGRPDAQTGASLLHFSLGTTQKSFISTPPKENVYLLFDRKTTPPRYTFSPQNQKTSLWIEPTLLENSNEVQIKVTLENDKGEKITEPDSYAKFNLTEKEFARYGGASWEVGSFRVDSTLLARQRARWFGPDRFLERHGGAEYQFAVGKQRVDFGEGDEIYSLFGGVGDCFIWNQNRWQTATPGKDSLTHPLLVVKKIEDRLMTFELWDAEGKGKLLLTLLKSSEPWIMQNAQHLQHMFKFVGARTRSQCVFEVNRERMVLKPSDWLLLTPKGWKKLESEQEIDQYVKRKLSGTLFVFEGLTRKEEKQVMKGSLYSPNRQDFQAIEIPLQAGGRKSPFMAKRETKDPDDDEDDDEEDGKEEEIKARLRRLAEIKQANTSKS